MVHTAVKTMQTCSLLQFRTLMGFGENLISYHFEKFPLKLTFRTEKVILFGADRFDSWIKVFHLKVSLRFEDGIVETNSAIYECNYVLIVGRYVVFLGNV